MFRRSQPSRIKPYLHAMSPGARAPEKGMLYRNNNMNAHARIASIQTSQRTPKENKIHLLLFVPDQIFLGFFVAATVGLAALLYSTGSPFQFNTHRNKFMSGGLNEHQFFRRNDEMNRIFAGHKEAIDAVRKEIEMPDVFRAPGEYESRSGTYDSSAAQ